ncbi:DASH complex subunit DAD1 [Aspergillus vadensis CBS 113365]|uniref:DASH complex subunit DAD1 n=1 Tax=Aspergillus vadensis (strain CBS 113365 / IMI 142717 / IBT 24658) TaxID=1448311 RepID=A0A319BMB4_ASPVC|nr:hypothetical protein BO88DRAFT_485322 [Aspergillus vadensis CBS 113365]PYH73029.1 hypothetical protein BO88DRAFT_485322 [Aspergillus vadensis CBS 113365]
MSTTPIPKNRSSSPTVFEQQRAELVREIAVGMEQVLQNINRLNRNLESIISVGNEFGSVEALWSQFENFMGSRPGEEQKGGGAGGGAGGGGGGGQHQNDEEGSQLQEEDHR